jgi:hypothetical protein
LGIDGPLKGISDVAAILNDRFDAPMKLSVAWQDLSRLSDLIENFGRAIAVGNARPDMPLQGILLVPPIEKDREALLRSLG